MSKPRIIIADTDLNYIIPLQLKFIEEFFDKIELEIITDKEYFERLFSTPQRADILIVSESLYNTALRLHNISNIFLLTEGSGNGTTEDLTVSKIFKYTSLKGIFNEIISTANGISDNTEKIKETKVVMIYSPIGGAGKTTAALGISQCLTLQFKKVLYVNAEHINSFQAYMVNRTPLPDMVSKELSTNNKQIYENLKHYIRKEGFDYLPPLRVSLSSLGVKYLMYKHFIECAKKSKEYDFILFDMESVFTDESAEMFEMADKIIILGLQDKASVFKLEMFFNNVSCNDEDKYIFICNKFNEEKDNELINNHKNIMISEYINNTEDFEKLKVQDFIRIEGYKKLAFIII